MEKRVNSATSISIFISYASIPRDEELLLELEKHLTPLTQQDSIMISHQRKLPVGRDREQALDEQLDNASVFLLLISPDYLASDRCRAEMERILARDAVASTKVIPILLRSTYLKNASFSHLQFLPRNGQPLTKWQDRDEAFQEIVGEIDVVLKDLSSAQKRQASEKEAKLRALFADNKSFIYNRLKSFVGRQRELHEIKQQIAARLPTGGYVTITGQAGQGKSSIIAKLVETYGIDQVAYHFIPLNSGPDHQVGLLRNLMARLILKYDLADFYVASDNRAALRDYFPKVLDAVVAQGGQETIFIDGLDQLEEDLNTVRDLTFLPTNPPPGIVFVLGTRPNDTLKPLELLKPHGEYRLPNLSREDFDLILQYRHVTTLKADAADQFYKLMDKNALYLDLAAKELTASDTVTPEEIIRRISANHNNIFSLPIERFMRQSKLWEKVIYPLLGILLVAQKPLSRRAIKSILNVEDYRIREGITKLGGLLAEDSQQCYSLFHLKFRDYLHQGEQEEQEEYLFSTEEEASYHAMLATWCERGSLEQIWQDVKESGEQERRIYARYHYIAHLYHAHRWSDLFHILDEGSYGQAKERYDVSTRSYIQDLDFGRRAASSSETFEEGLENLPHLWRYTLLRCSLRSRADQYPLELFQVMLAVGREQEVLGLAEWLTDPVQKVTVFQTIAEHFAHQPACRAEGEQLSLRAYEIARGITEREKRAEALRLLASSLAKAQRWEQAEPMWEQAEEVACAIVESEKQAEVLRALASSLAEAQRWEQAEPVWEQAERVARSIGRAWEQTLALKGLASSLAEAQRWEQAEEVACSITEGREQAQALITLANSLAKTQCWERAEAMWEQAEGVARSITESEKQVEALITLASSLAGVQRWERAEAMWEQAEVSIISVDEEWKQNQASRALVRSLAEAQRWGQAERVARSITEDREQSWALGVLACSLAKTQHWEQAEEVIRSITEGREQAEALITLALALVSNQDLEWAKIECMKAERLVRAITESEKQARALEALAVSLTKAQRWEQAKPIWEHAERIIQSIIGSSEQARARRGLAISLAKAQLWGEAERVAYSITEYNTQIEVLRELARWLAKAQRWEEAERVAYSINEDQQQAWTLEELAISLVKAQSWEEAERVARSIIKGWQQARALEELAISLVKAQRWEEAERVAHSIIEDQQQARALEELAISLVKAQRWEQAEAMWEQAERAIRTITEGEEQARALRTLASSLAKAQHWEEAERVAHSIIEDQQQARALEELAISLVKAQRWEQAEAMWEQAERVIRTITEDLERTWVLEELASSLAKAQRWEQAEAMWEQAERVARSIAKGWEQAMALQGVMSSLAEAQRWEEAERVARSISEGRTRARALEELASFLAKAQQWKQAERVARSITESGEQVEALQKLAEALIKFGEYQSLLSLVQRSWLQGETRAFALQTFFLALGLIARKPEMGIAFYEAFQWVDTFLSS